MKRNEKAYASDRNTRVRLLAFIALLAGGAAVGLSPILVRLSDVGPAASAFWRLALAAPVFWIWFALQPPSARAMPRSFLVAVLLAGIFFAADLAVWHWSIAFTTVANSTLLANFAPIFVTLGGWLLFRDRVSQVFLVGMSAALFGTLLLVGPSFEIGGARVTGDLLALLAAVFYASYMLAIKKVRAGVSTAALMAFSTTVSVIVLLPVVLLSPQPMLPGSARGWSVLFALALVSQILGQSLIAYAFAHLSAALSSVAVLTQPVVAAVLAWMLFGEALTLPQLLGALFVLAGIFIARRAG